MTFAKCSASHLPAGSNGSRSSGRSRAAASSASPTFPSTATSPLSKAKGASRAEARLPPVHMTLTPRPPHAGARTFAGLFLVTLATLTYQLLLTRVFSVTMYYHFAFVAISVTMFGMSVGAVIVYLRRDVFTDERLSHHLASGALGFAIAIV